MNSSQGTCVCLGQGPCVDLSLRKVLTHANLMVWQAWQPNWSATLCSCCSSIPAVHVCRTLLLPASRRAGVRHPAGHQQPPRPGAHRAHLRHRIPPPAPQQGGEPRLGRAPSQEPSLSLRRPHLLCAFPPHVAVDGCRAASCRANQTTRLPLLHYADRSVTTTNGRAPFRLAPVAWARSCCGLLFAYPQLCRWLHSPMWRGRLLTVAGRQRAAPCAILSEAAHQPLLPSTPLQAQGGKVAQEAAVEAALTEHGIEVIVLARYMQVPES